MNLPPIILSLLLFFFIGCSEMNSDTIPTSRTTKLSCGSWGAKKIGIEIEEKVPTQEQNTQYEWILSNWPELWPKIEQEFATIISDYEYGTSLDQLLEKKENALILGISEEGLGDDTNWSISLKIKHERGHHLLLCEFKDSEITYSQPMF